jgi:hypothetical protein
MGNRGAHALFPLSAHAPLFPKILPREANVSSCMPGIALKRRGICRESCGGGPTQEHQMPNRGELPIPAMRGRGAVKSRVANPDAGAWTIIAFCAIGCLMSLCLAASSAGADALPRLLSQVPLG